MNTPEAQIVFSQSHSHIIPSDTSFTFKREIDILIEEKNKEEKKCYKKKSHRSWNFKRTINNSALIKI